MNPEARTAKYGVALLAPRMCLLGADPCGGSEVVLWEDAAILKSAGIPVRVYGRAAQNGAPVSVIPLRTNAPLLTSIEYAGRFLRREPRAMLISYNEPSVAGWAPDRSIARFDWDTPLPRYANWPSWRPRFERARYLFPSESERAVFRNRHAHIPPANTAVIPNAVDLAYFRPAAHAADSLVRPPRVGYAGQWVPRKGIAELLQAWRIVRSEFPAAELHMAGGEDLWQNVGETSQAEPTAVQVRRMEVEGLLKIRGALPRAGMPEFWNSIDLAVVPSLYEPFGLVALEALACGVPVVATTAGGLKEIVEDGKSGLLVPPGDAPALARALLDILTNQDLRSRLAAGARRRAGDFSLAARSRRLLQILRFSTGGNETC